MGQKRRAQGGGFGALVGVEHHHAVAVEHGDLYVRVAVAVVDRQFDAVRLQMRASRRRRQLHGQRLADQGNGVFDNVQTARPPGTVVVRVGAPLAREAEQVHDRPRP